ncbi:MAG: hypothetical protein ABI700_12230 [Chloroflexota bacterium]
MNAQVEALRLQIAQLMKKAQLASVIALCELKLADEDADIRVVALLGLSNAVFHQGKFAPARQYLAQAMELAREQGSPEAQCSLLRQNNFFIKLMIVPTEARHQLALGQDTLKLAESSGFQEGIVYAKIAMGNAHLEMGMKNAAQAELEEAVSIAGHLSADVEVDALSELASFFYVKRLSVKAIDNGQRALNLARETGDYLSTCLLLSNMSYYYFRVARDFRSYDSSIEYSQRGLALARQLGTVYGEYVALRALGNSYHIARLTQQAAESFQAALDIARSSGYQGWEYECLARLSGLHTTLRNYDQAWAYAQQEMALANELKQPRWQIHALNIIGNVYNGKKQPDLALEYWRKAMALQVELGMNHGLIYHFSRFIHATYPFTSRLGRK